MQHHHNLQPLPQPQYQRDESTALCQKFHKYKIYYRNSVLSSVAVYKKSCSFWSLTSNVEEIFDFVDKTLPANIKIMAGKIWAEQGEMLSSKPQ